MFESVETLDQAQFAAYVELRQRSGDRGHCELLNGRVVMNPPAGYPHGKIGSKIQLLLGNFVLAGGLGEVFDSSQGFELPSGDTVEPDHSFVSKQRWAEAPPPEFGKFLRVVPDLIVEVLSPSTASQDRGEKKAIYQANRVREYWLVDARARCLTVFQLEGDRFDRGQIINASERFRSSVLEGLVFEVNDILV